MDFNNKERLLLKSLIIYYKESNHLEVLLHFLKGKQRRLSLRLLDWLVTNYSKKHAVVIKDISSNNTNIEFMYLAYKNHLKSYSKKFFDAFARRQRIFYKYNHHVHKIRMSEMNAFYDSNDGFVTTIAQLNAFCFFISAGVVEYAINHLEEIESDMVHAHVKKYNDMKSETNFQTCVTYKVRMTVTFR